MTDDDKRRPPEPTPWDRLGMVLGDLAVAGKNMADRNLTLWSSVSQNLRKDSYTADDWTTDAARAMSTAMVNVQEAWETVVRPPERELVAFTLPTAFLVFTPRVLDDGSIRYGPVDPVWMRVRGADGDDLPRKAEIEITGDEAGVAALKQRLSTERGTSRRAYLLQISDPDDPKREPRRSAPTAGGQPSTAAEAEHCIGDAEPQPGTREPEVRKLVAGVYGGTVYIKKPVRPIANLRIIVEPVAPKISYTDDPAA